MSELVRASSDALNDLVIAALERIESDGLAGLDELCREHPGSANELRQRIDALREAGLLRGEVAVARLERLGEFELLEELGHGGMGIVYRARQVSLGREVALKIVRPEQLYFPGARERFRREVESVARLRHPGIVPVYAVGEDRGVPYFAMELVRGRDLEAILARVAGRAPGELRGVDLAPDDDRGDGRDGRDGRGWLFEGTWEQACLRVMRQVCEALEHAHAQGVLHRDLKPSNVMLTSDGASRALLFDFGLATTSAGRERLTRSGAVLGSLGYMAPEQLRGELDALDARADVYALGATLYEMLTLTPAFRGSDAAVLQAIERADLVPPRERNPAISWEAETVCLTAMEREPRRRYATAADFARDLANALERRPIEARRAGRLLRARRWIERHPTAATSIALGAVLLVGGPLLYAA